MATVKQEIDDAAGECGITALPSSWLGQNSDQLMMQRLLRAVVRDVIDRHDWTGSSTTVTLQPTTQLDVWGFPDDFHRLQRGENSVFEVSPNRRPVVPMVDDGDWQELNAWSAAGVQRYYRRTSQGLEFYRPVPAGATVKISYVTGGWVVGGASEWTSSNEATAVPVFPSQLIRFGVISRWRRQKGLPYEAEQAEYESVLARSIGEDRPRRLFRTDGPSLQSPHPMRVPVPDFIPGG